MSDLNSDSKTVLREILLGFWKVHILHHAGEGPVVGQWLLRELHRHGHEVSPGTLYPLLRRLEGYGWLRCEQDSKGGKRAMKRYYLTEQGGRVLATVRAHLTELHSETCLNPGGAEDR